MPPVQFLAVVKKKLTLIYDENFKVQNTLLSQIILSLSSKMNKPGGIVLTIYVRVQFHRTNENWSRKEKKTKLFTSSPSTTFL